MLTPEELFLLESLVDRARRAAGADRAAVSDPIVPGDVVQLQPGTCPFWKTTLMLVTRIRDDGGISGPLLITHRGGCREAWYTFRPPEVVRIGRSPYPQPTERGTPFCTPCPIFPEKRPVWKETRGRKKKAG